MPRGYIKGSMILSKDGHKYSNVYRGILEVLARFGYASIKEVMYGFHLNLTQAVDRLRYLEQSGFIQRFPSHILPVSFFCLTPHGRKAIRNFSISGYIDPFLPDYYQLVYQEHHRAIIKAFLALKMLLRDDFLDWTSESFLKVEGAHSKVKRILDGELFLRVRKTYLKKAFDGKLVEALNLDPVNVDWKCGIEVELSLKSPTRYIKQFRELSRQIYTGYSHEQHYPMLIFFYSTQTIRDKLAHQLKEGNHDFGNCIFFLAQIDQFTSNPETAPVERWVGTICRKTIAQEMKRAQVYRE